MGIMGKCSRLDKSKERVVHYLMTVNRRKFPRVTTYLPVRLRLERSGRHLETLARDVGMGGVRCLVDVCPEINERVTMEVPLYKEVLPIQTHARIAWVQPVSTTQCVVGVCFDQLAPADSRALASYLDHLTAPL